MVPTENPYEGIQFYPLPNKYAATIGRGKYTKVISFLDTLADAIQARRVAIEERKSTREA